MVQSKSRRPVHQQAYIELARHLVSRPEGDKYWDREEQRALAAAGSVVYYIWRNGLVKIGFSTNIRGRMYQLHVERRQLLAVEQGPMELEQQRHIEFLAHRVHGEGLGVEHYWPSKSLLDHINGLRESAGQPRLVIGLRPVAAQRELHA